LWGCAKKGKKEKRKRERKRDKQKKKKEVTKEGQRKRRRKGRNKKNEEDKWFYDRRGKRSKQSWGGGSTERQNHQNREMEQKQKKEEEKKKRSVTTTNISTYKKGKTGTFEKVVDYDTTRSREIGGQLKKCERNSQPEYGGDPQRPEGTENSGEKKENAGHNDRGGETRVVQLNSAGVGRN